ncbi:elongation factor Tu [Methanocella sp. CWC-04]|uniref:Elongation factor Tu n=1 Tax=Methanooceanicella nereidis TaxID=2052831 RepID=A0AAP2RE31_9EURY|nr:EF-Tu/IF-2/RF-3 family GTPase [Methanocella sp. CWC-04]MCD1295462.1 elongation factor Tu [Methanocella sp. CWC-04]
MVKVALVGGEKSGKTTLASKLGKKGTESDIVLYDFVKGDNIISIVDPIGYPKSPKPLVNAVNMADVVVFCVDAAGLDARAGECIILMDLVKPKHGIITITKTDTSNPYAVEELKNKIKMIAKGTVVENWEVIPTSTNVKAMEGIDKLKDVLFEYDNKLKEEHKTLLDKPVRIPIDHHFNVTGIGCVILGYVDQGVVNAKEKLTVFPIKHEVEIRSIQMHDVDVKQAPAGARVGLAIKGIQSKDLDRGHIISASENVAEDFSLKCVTAKFKGEFKKGDKVHVYTGLQSTPGNIVKIIANGNEVEETKSSSAYEVVLKTDKEVAYSPGDRFILSKLDDPKQRFLATGTI